MLYAMMIDGYRLEKSKFKTHVSYNPGIESITSPNFYAEGTKARRRQEVLNVVEEPEA